MKGVKRKRGSFREHEKTVEKPLPILQKQVSVWCLSSYEIPDVDEKLSAGELGDVLVKQGLLLLDFF